MAHILVACTVLHNAPARPFATQTKQAASQKLASFRQSRAIEPSPTLPAADTAGFCPCTLRSAFAAPSLRLIPSVFIQVRERDLAIARVDIVHAGMTFFVERSIGHRGAVRQRDLICLSRNRLAFAIVELDFDPVLLLLVVWTVRIVRRSIGSRRRIGRRIRGRAGSRAGR